MPKADDETLPQLHTAASKAERQVDTQMEDEGWDSEGVGWHVTAEEPFEEAGGDGLEDGIIITVWNALKGIFGAGQFQYVDGTRKR